MRAAIKAAVGGTGDARALFDRVLDMSTRIYLRKSLAEPQSDLLLALSCREAGCVLVTENERNFARIRRFVPFDFVPPWP